MEEKNESNNKDNQCRYYHPVFSLVVSKIIEIHRWYFEKFYDLSKCFIIFVCNFLDDEDDEIYNKEIPSFMYVYMPCLGVVVGASISGDTFGQDQFY